ncbi:alpha-galactosidase [Peribacillus deserti]|uniref:Alpha-galactosidase n=1 Tax=Peribacillus deserti TaxID=673318 RepID=A0ABS2QMZ7_9BACI|nr:alpha-galactosidase [Peribacillus deserti]MBM7693848.1 alpha-galactosidase [Peribacillus deserti]
MGIRVRKDNRVFSLDGKNSSYLLCIDKQGHLLHLYWGGRISNLEDFDLPFVKGISTFEAKEDIMAEEFTPWGQLRFKEPSLKAGFLDGTRDLDLVFDGYREEGEVLSISLTDSFYQVKIQIVYQVFAEFDVIKRYVILNNLDDHEIRIQSFYSGEWNFLGSDFYFTNVQGTWANEGNRFRQKILPGKNVIESRRGITAHNHSPYFMLDRDAKEHSGEVYFGILAHSGNFKLTIEQKPYDQTRLLLGMNGFDTEISVSPEASFETPPVYFGYTVAGFNGASNSLNQLGLHLLPEKHRETVRPVLYNSWEAARFNVTCDNQAVLAEKAAQLGVELFVVDDGWFKNRNNSSAGLGDWYPDESKFPEGLDPLIKKVKSLDMKFGLWLEPEMVNPDSYLYRMHPDWVYGFENRKHSLSRKQLILNITKQEVRNYLFFVIDQLLTKHDISFIKWDMNRPFSEPGALNLPKENQQEIWMLHNRHVLALIKELRDKHPHVLWEGCASGGGRVNFEALQYFDQFWPSDNTDALDRLSIQHGYSLAYPIKTMVSWVTDSPNMYTKREIPLKFRCHAAMMGAMGIGCNLNKLTAEDSEILSQNIAFYKKVRTIIQEGCFYRLSSITESGYHAVQYTKDQRSVIFAFKRGVSRHKKNFQLKLKGFKPETRYCISLQGKVAAIKSGDYLMNAGISLHLEGEYDSCVFEIFPKMGELYKNKKSKINLF